MKVKNNEFLKICDFDFNKRPALRNKQICKKIKVIPRPEWPFLRSNPDVDTAEK